MKIAPPRNEELVAPLLVTNAVLTMEVAACTGHRNSLRGPQNNSRSGDV